MAEKKRRLVVGISGATGIAYAARLLELLKDSDVESHLVVSRAADITRAAASVTSVRPQPMLPTIAPAAPSRMRRPSDVTRYDPSPATIVGNAGPPGTGGANE